MKNTPSEMLRIKTADIIKYGNYSRLMLFNNTPIYCKVFTGFMDMFMCIESYLRYSNLPKNVIYSIQSMFDSVLYDKKFDWNEFITEDDKNELGKYFGEFLYGLYRLVTNDDIVRLGFPIENNTPIIDSILEPYIGDSFGISSKYGGGSNSSFFTGILAFGINKISSMKSCIFKDMCKYAKKNKTIENREHKEFLYNFGLTYLLKEEKDYFKLLYPPTKENIKNGVFCTIIEKVRVHKFCTYEMQKLLPESITGFLSRSIAKVLNSDAQSIEEIEKIINNQNIIQVTLNQDKFKNGYIEFVEKSFNNCKVKIAGNKSPIALFGGNRGMLSYRIH